MRGWALILGAFFLTAGSPVLWAQESQSGFQADQPLQEPPPYQGSGPPPLQQPADEAPGPPAQFYDQLAPYGSWIDTPDYGWVWQPSPSVVGGDFQPYATGGQWINTTDGWVFQSQWPFGWATFHYGRWYYDPNYGWLWVPGDQWAPSWVDWRYGDGYVGWVPLAPPGFSFSVNFGFGFGVYPGWCFVPVQYFTAPNVYVHTVPVTRVHHLVVTTHPTGRYVHSHGVRWNRGPDAAVVHRAGAPVVVHPSVRPRTTIQAHPAPRTVTPIPLPSYPAPAPHPVPAPRPVTPHPAPAPRPVMPHPAPMPRPVTPHPIAPAPHPIAPAPHPIAPAPHPIAPMPHPVTPPAH